MSEERPSRYPYRPTVFRRNPALSPVAALHGIPMETRGRSHCPGAIERRVTRTDQERLRPPSSQCPVVPAPRGNAGRELPRTRLAPIRRIAGRHHGPGRHSASAIRRLPPPGKCLDHQSSRTSNHWSSSSPAGGGASPQALTVSYWEIRRGKPAWTFLERKIRPGTHNPVRNGGDWNIDAMANGIRSVQEIATEVRAVDPEREPRPRPRRSGR